ncbi:MULTISPECIES: dihydroorotate dehydrogenase [unclassified Roseivivax]|uniref:dihydroorotate dehydrogenase n=1 Tax=unclassified Roseivivax TaxID=2639302 RepID=UPI0012A98612|nr:MULTISPECIES: dihydroorotate dehydrogenase [unclassified Roseivivax]QFT48931.1 Dihydroorotate dehydrogenase B (NAD(+)), catalytic subunit [Roseivivax sp. THAF40]QFT65085.1 Dihydroorotate dehydrogenase B (NAD(+)), catalytic subunit [Roseivivax sp. THAF30]
MPDLSINIAGIEMKNPLTVGSGTYGHHGNFNQFFPVETMGVLVPKTVRPIEWPGNSPRRVIEVPSGLHSSVGIPSISWEQFEAVDAPRLRDLPVPVIQSVIGRTEVEYAEVVARASALNAFQGLELNLSCPNLKQGGLDFGYDPDAAYKLVKRARQETDLPLVAKLAPDYSSLVSVAQAIEAAGADAVALVNAPRAMCIDIETLKPMIGNGVGALSGPAIKPMAVYMVWTLYRSISLPIFGMGGVANYKDVIEFMAAGAAAVAFGTVSYVDPMALPRALVELETWLVEKGIDDVKSLIGAAHGSDFQRPAPLKEMKHAV